jgi:error-prone DNA polymerase
MVPLHLHSYYSLLRGVDSPDTLVRRAAELGYRALAITDRDSLYGTIRFNIACRDAGISPVFGAEVTLDDHYHVTLLAGDRAGYANLARVLSISRLAHEKGEASTTFDVLADHANGLICLSGPRTGPIPTLVLEGKRSAAADLARRYQAVFRDRFFLELQNHLLPDDAWLAAELAALGDHVGAPLVATLDVHYAHTSGRATQDVLTAIRTRTTLSQPSPERLPNAEFYLKSPDAMVVLFRRYPEVLAMTDRIAQCCRVDLDFRDARFPPLALPGGATPDEHLGNLAFRGARERYGDLSDAIVRQLDHELGIISRRGMAPFFLIAHDVARRFRGRCRGSAAGSVVVYSLGMSAVDPITHGMLFERFINPERGSPPDIDLDFSQDEREKAIAYMYATYGADNAGMVANYVRFKSRSAIRDVGKVLGMPADLVGQLAKSVDHRADGNLAEEVARFAARSPGEARPWPLLVQFCTAIDDLPRHLSIHAGGMLVTGRPLIECFGLENARKRGVVVVGADKEDVEDAGLAKLDLLCLGSMSVVQECETILQARGESFTLATIPLDDPDVYDAIQRADTIGASQVESRAQMQSVVRTRPRTFTDLMAQVAIIRPGPITGGMVQSYYRRKTGAEPVRYLHAALKPILASTLGIILYQEQVLLCVSALTGCSAGEADVFRRAMGSHRSREAMSKLRPWFLERAIANGIAPAVATAAYEQIAGFANFGFCRSHAAALARLAYETVFLKLYYPTVFTAALLNHQPMGFYPIGVVVADARRHGVPFLPVDINRSGATCLVEGEPAAVRLGFTMVRWVGKDAAEGIVAEREAHGPYPSLADFGARASVTGKAAEGLILSGAFDTIDGRPRPEQLWELYGRNGTVTRPALPLSENAGELPELSRHEQMLRDHLILGFSLSQHFTTSYRARLRALGVIPSRDLDRRRDGEVVRVGGLVVCRQRPETAKGFVFISVEDEWGLVNIIASPGVFQTYRTALRDSALIAVAGRLQKADGTLNVIAAKAIALDPRVPDAPAPTPGQHISVGPRSHDFH